MGLRTTTVRSIALVVALVLLVSIGPGPPAAGAVAPGPWARPVAGGVARPFVAPRAKYGPGHRGVDLFAAPGTPVVAAREGVVTFAGSVAGSLHVVVDHGAGLVTSYSFLAIVGVRRGERVVRGQALGAAGGTGPEHLAGVVHFGLRVDGEYVDPMTLFSPVDLAAVIRLVPAHPPEQVGLSTPVLEARSLTDSLRLPRAIPGLEPAAEPSWWDEAVRGAGHLAGGLFATGAVLVRPFVVVGRDVLAHTVLGPVLSDLRTMASRFGEYLDSREHCTGDTGVAAGGGGSGHLMMAVGGINSSTDRRTGLTFGLDTEALGYRAGEVSWFSYASNGGNYQKSDTWGDLIVKAYALRDQLRELQRNHPGREVDLIAHSQGGVVVDAFMQIVFDPADPTLPPLGTVVTLSSPHRGAPAASVAREIRASSGGRQLLEWAESIARGALPPTGGRSTRQLAEGSRLMRHLWDRPIPEQLDVTSLGAPDDAVVPADSTRAPGARHVMTDPAGFGDHSAIVADPAAMREVRLALEQQPPGCVGWLQGIRGAIEPVVIRRIELGLGHAVSRSAGALGGLRLGSSPIGGAMPTP